MIAPSLYAELAGRGVRLSIAPGEGLKLRVQAPPGAFTAAHREAVERHRAELVQFVFELAERAALHLERDDASPAEWEAAERFALAFVRGGGATPDRARLDIAEHHPAVLHLQSIGLIGEIVSVRPLKRESEAA